MHLNEYDVARFHALTSLPDEDGCQLWTGYVSPNGYGQLQVDGRPVGAHRIAALLAHGQPFPGANATHSCRNRHCVAAAHLTWATPQKNQHDRYRDGTDSRGTHNGRAVLTPDQVLAIVSRTGESHVALARDYGVTPTQIRAIRTGKRWSHLTGIGTAALAAA